MVAAGRVQRPLYHPSLNPSYQIINATDAWAAAGGRSVAGAGIMIGDIDTGIDPNASVLRSDRLQLSSGLPKCDVPDSNWHRVNRVWKPTSRQKYCCQSLLWSAPGSRDSMLWRFKIMGRTRLASQLALPGRRGLQRREYR